MNAVDVIGYTYEASCHCIACTQKRFASGGFDIIAASKDDDTSKLDENGIAYCATDREGNLIHPVFGDEELQTDDEGESIACTCDTCGETIKD